MPWLTYTYTPIDPTRPFNVEISGALSPLLTVKPIPINARLISSTQEGDPPDASQGVSTSISHTVDANGTPILKFTVDGIKKSPANDPSVIHGLRRPTAQLIIGPDRPPPSAPAPARDSASRLPAARTLSESVTQVVFETSGREFAYRTLPAGWPLDGRTPPRGSLEAELQLMTERIEEHGRWMRDSASIQKVSRRAMAGQEKRERRTPRPGSLEEAIQTWTYRERQGPQERRTPRQGSAGEAPRMPSAGQEKQEKRTPPPGSIEEAIQMWDRRERQGRQESRLPARGSVEEASRKAVAGQRTQESRTPGSQGSSDSAATVRVAKARARETADFASARKVLAREPRLEVLVEDYSAREALARGRKLQAEGEEELRRVRAAIGRKGC